MTQPYFFRIFKDPTTATVKTVIETASIEAVSITAFVLGGG